LLPPSSTQSVQDFRRANDLPDRLPHALREAFLVMKVDTNAHFIDQLGWPTVICNDRHHPQRHRFHDDTAAKLTDAWQSQEVADPESFQHLMMWQQTVKADAAPYTHVIDHRLESGSLRPITDNFQSKHSFP